MLGENHSLINEFPEFKKRIAELNDSNIEFSTMSHRYDELDTEIRQLELNNAPIDDNAMHKLKHQRVELKDRLYQFLLKAT